YWQKITQIETQPLPKDHLHQQVLAGASESITVQWNREETEQLLKQVPRAYNTEVNDILLTALGMALHSWSGLSQVKINLEGHGREEILPELDITRTVGWFTSQYPVLLEIKEGKHLGYQIKSVKEALRQIPNKGIGYGIWRYLSRHAEGMEWGVEPEISFNYLGQFDQDIQEEGVSPYSTGATSSDKHLRNYALDLNGMVSEGELMLDISYSPLEYHRGTIEKLAQCLKERLQEIIAHCITKEKTELTPSDVLLKGLTIEEVEQIVEQTKAIGEIENIYRLTPMQKGMLFHSQMDPQSGAYFEQTIFNMQGRLNIELFKDSFEKLVKRHAILRTNFYSEWKEEPLQVVYRTKNIDFYYEDLRKLAQNESEAYIEKFMEQDKKRSFDLRQDALMRLSILHIENTSYRFIWSFHHILMDGWCLPVLLKEVIEMYEASQEQRSPKLPAVASYSGYIEWLEQQENEKAEAYWKKYLAGYDQQTLLLQPKVDGKATEYVQKHVICDLDEDVTRKINDIAQEHQVTVNTFIQTVWGLLLQKYNGNQDVVFGSVVSGRPTEVMGIEHMIGLFINTIPVRIRCEAEESFVSLIQSIQEQALASQTYDYYPLYEIQALTEQKQSLINHIVVFENYPVEEEMEQQTGQVQDQLEITDAMAIEQTNYDFNLIVIPGEELKIILEYNAVVYDFNVIEQIQRHLLNLFAQITKNPQIAVQDIEVVTADEKHRMLEEFNQTVSMSAEEKTLYQLFEEQVERSPEQTAVVFEDHELTYRELNERANKLARKLQAAGVKTESVVGIMMERSVEMIVGILGILKAGGAYLPIDPLAPEERIHFMLTDSGVDLVVTLQEQEGKLPQEIHKLYLTDDTLKTYAGNNLPISSSSHQLSYVIYTSGTTGNPKGVMIEHRNVSNLVLGLKEHIYKDYQAPAVLPGFHRMSLMLPYSKSLPVFY
ncbi:condensation domain-containing protein, partial [Caldalkalibacillus mannanilyticus]|uniref:condensation domain-containing protein n=1 Tax=Caldalkalibacillus mannanilyticus TaxID=1418 RepID=UPI00046956D9